MVKYSGYGKANALLDELEELKQSAQLRANSIQFSDARQSKAQAAADAYAFAQLRIMHYMTE